MADCICRFWGFGDWANWATGTRRGERFSAANAGSNIAGLVAWVVARGTAVSSDVAVEEARRNLALKRPARLPAFEALLPRVEIVPSMVFPIPVMLANKDLPLLCAAIRGGCDAFVTGDRQDFGHLMNRTIEGVRVVSPLQLAKRLAEKEKWARNSRPHFSRRIPAIQFCTTVSGLSVSGPTGKVIRNRWPSADTS